MGRRLFNIVFNGLSLKEVIISERIDIIMIGFFFCMRNECYLDFRPQFDTRC